METSCSANRMISFSRMEDGREVETDWNQNGVLSACVFFVSRLPSQMERLKPPASGGGGGVGQVCRARLAAITFS